MAPRSSRLRLPDSLRLGRRIRQWFHARLPATDAWTLTQRNVYILPTKAGLVFGFTLVVMLLASINYQLNLGYVLTFLLAGSGLVSMHVTHAGLRGLTAHLRPVAPVNAGDPATLEVVVSNPGRTRHGLGVCFLERSADDGVTWFDVPAQGQETVRIRMVPPHRGLHAVPVLSVETSFPLGLFRAWTVWRPAAQVLAYPRPESPPAPLPPASPVPGERPMPHAPAGSELDGVRPWRRGDSLRQVAWKKVARAGEMVSRDTAAQGSRELWLDWQAAGGADVESRLSRLAAWVQVADREGLNWGLRLPGREPMSGQGDGQRRAALQALALWR